MFYLPKTLQKGVGHQRGSIQKPEGWLRVEVGEAQNQINSLTQVYKSNRTISNTSRQAKFRTRRQNKLQNTGGTQENVGWRHTMEHNEVATAERSLQKQTRHRFNTRGKKTFKIRQEIKKMPNRDNYDLLHVRYWCFAYLFFYCLCFAPAETPISSGLPAGFRHDPGAVWPPGPLEEERPEEGGAPFLDWKKQQKVTSQQASVLSWRRQ